MGGKEKKEKEAWLCLCVVYWPDRKRKEGREENHCVFVWWTLMEKLVFIGVWRKGRPCKGRQLEDKNAFRRLPTIV